MNVGTHEALAVTGTLSTDHFGVTVNGSGAVYFGDIAGGALACGADSSQRAGHCSWGPTVSVSTSVALGTAIPFNLTLLDPLGNRFTLPLSYVAQ